jgi:hypothetical protein
MADQLLPQVYRKDPPYVVSYNYADLFFEGVGVQILNGFSHKEQTTLSYGLTLSSVYSNDTSTSSTQDGTDFTKTLDMDFDIKLNLAQQVQGNLKLSGSFGGGTTAAANRQGEGYMIFRLRKVSGGVEGSDIATAQTETLTWGSSVMAWKTFNVQIAVNSVNNFKSQDTLRITAELWAKKTGSTACPVVFAHDPKNRVVVGAGGATAADTSQFLVAIPFTLV